MTALATPAEDGLVDALLMEIAGLLDRLIAHGEAGSIDLRGLPLSPSCLANLERRLGQGEVTMDLDAAGRSALRETGFPGVWWTRHADEGGRVVALLIEVAVVPDIVRADVADMAHGLRRLRGRTPIVAPADARIGG